MAEKSQPAFIAKDYQAPQVSDWCAGCGDFGILKALQRAFAELALPPEQVAVFGGIGCSGKTPYYLTTNGIHTLHGRVLPFAAGAKLADPGLTVVAVGGDGDGLSIGAGHFVAAGRRNLDLTYILFNNGVYGLTKGQAAPTLRLGEQTRSMPQAAGLESLSPILLALSAGYTWIGRGYAYDVAGLAELIVQAIHHPGTAMLEVLQPCPTYNDLHTREWYAAKDSLSGEGRLYPLAATGYDPLIGVDSDDATAAARRAACFAKGSEWGARIPLGVFLKDLSRPPYPAGGRSPSRQAIESQGRPLADITSLLSQLR